MYKRQVFGFVVSANNPSGVDVIGGVTSIPSGLSSLCYIDFTPTSAGFSLLIRCGCGPTTNSTNIVTISNPILTKINDIPTVGTPWNDAELWNDPEPWTD